MVRLTDMVGGWFEVLRPQVWLVGVGFGSLQDGGAGFSFVGCFSDRFSNGEDESDRIYLRAAISSLYCWKYCFVYLRNSAQISSKHLTDMALIPRCYRPPSLT